ncbi:MAG TPA: helix-turn-helix domain-containing protein [Terrimicrobiaceae bacterium]|nr:helix-turn-helix domain-containing protein [Terrimicrobiaceae bacterium]
MKKDQIDISNSEPSFSPVLAHALGHPLRVRFLEYLAVETASPKTLATAFGVPLGDASYHLKRVLDRECGLVEVVRRRQRRGALETFYRVDRDAFRRLVDWESLPPALDEALKGSSLRAFLNVASEALGEGKMDADQATLCWQPVALDGPGWIEVKKALSGAEAAVKQAIAKSASRLDSDSTPIHAIVGLAAVPVLRDSRGAEDPRSDNG